MTPHSAQRLTAESIDPVHSRSVPGRILEYRDRNASAHRVALLRVIHDPRTRVLEEVHGALNSPCECSGTDPSTGETRAARHRPHRGSRNRARSCLVAPSVPVRSAPDTRCPPTTRFRFAQTTQASSLPPSSITGKLTFSCRRNWAKAFGLRCTVISQSPTVSRGVRPELGERSLSSQRRPRARARSPNVSSSTCGQWCSNTLPRSAPPGPSPRTATDRERRRDR